MSTHTPIATQTLASAASSVTFSSIPQGYTDLVLIANRLSSSLDNLSMQFNGDTGSNYSFTVLYGTGSTAGSARSSNTNNPYLDYYAASESTFAAPVILNIQNYANSTTYKTTLARGSNASRGVDATVMLWRSTSAITSILLKCHDGSNFTSGSTFSLYGIAVGNSSAKADGGSSVTTDGTYYYHTFKSSGLFIPRQALTNVDYLVVAGGGGGGSMGGGGAGGLRSTVTATGGGGSLESKLSLSKDVAYPVIVGAGGSGVSASPIVGISGGNSVFGSITSTGGGGGGGYSNTPSLGSGANGGSGGGSSYTQSVTPRGLGTVNQGYDGGISNQSTKGSGGGGGGAGAVGGDGTATTGVGGVGGAGVAVAISGSSVTYAGGGGGSGEVTAGAGGAGGGGAGRNFGSSTGPVSGTTSTGGGGGGSYHTNGLPSANGGSGIVIIRYAV